MKKVLPVIISTFLINTLVSSAAVGSLSLKSDVKSMATDDNGTVKIVLDEDFSLMTEGSEGNPSADTIEDDNSRIPSSKTKMPGWMGYYLREAGGMVYIDLDPKGIESGIITTPRVNVSEAGGAFTISFRARSAVKGGSDKIFVDSKDDNESDYHSQEVKVTDAWADYTLKFESGGTSTYVMLSPWLDPVYIDDVRIEMLIPKIMAPKSLSFNNYTGDGFTASWEAVDGASEYLLSVYTKNADGSRDYYMEKKKVEGLSYDLADLPVKDSFYYFVVQASDGVNVSPESVEMVVEALLRPVILPETDITENSFTANWEPVNLAKNYNFIATLEHTATAAETYYFINEDFNNVKPLDTYYDYTSIPELPGWTIASPAFLDGEVGVKSSYGQYGEDAWIQSSIYNLSHNGGDVHVKMSIYCNHKKYTSDVLIGLYTYSDADNRFKVTDYAILEGIGMSGKDVDIVLKGGGERSLFMIQPDGYADLMIKNLEMSQELAAGEEVSKTIVSMSTTEPTLKVENIQHAEGDKVSYIVRAVGRNSTDTSTIYSDYTSPKYVDLVNAGVGEINADDFGGRHVVYNLQGIKVMVTDEAAALNSLPKGIYIVNGKKTAIR